MRNLNPNDSIFFIYDEQLLTKKARQSLSTFCSQFNIVAKELHKDVFPHCQTDDEKQLIQVYQAEKNHLFGKGSNPALLSDILRLLSPVYELGTYSDFDVLVDTRRLPKTMDVKKPILLPIGSGEFAYKNKVFEEIVCNTDVFAVINNDDAKPIIQTLQKSICHTYQQDDVRIFFDGILNFYGQRPKGLSQEYVNQQMAKNPALQDVNLLATLANQLSFVALRQKVLKGTSSDEAFISLFNQSIKNFNRDDFLQCLKRCYPDVSEKDRIRVHRFMVKMDWLKLLTLYMTGPGLILKTFWDKKVMNKDDFKKEVSPFSLLTYSGLNHAFQSSNRCSLYSNPEKKAPDCQTLPPNDLSWLDVGREKMLEVDFNMEKAAKFIQKFWRNNNSHSTFNFFKTEKQALQSSQIKQTSSLDYESRKPE